MLKRLLCHGGNRILSDAVSRIRAPRRVDLDNAGNPHGVALLAWGRCAGRLRTISRGYYRQARSALLGEACSDAAGGEAEEAGSAGADATAGPATWSGGEGYCCAVRRPSAAIPTGTNAAITLSIDFIAFYTRTIEAIVNLQVSRPTSAAIQRL
jgi:hypothetical protein